jgi:hypothetical protein
MPSAESASRAGEMPKANMYTSLQPFGYIMKTYPSKIDWWISVALSASPLIFLINGVATLSYSPLGGWVCLIMAIIIALIILLLAIPYVYFITDDYLIIRSGRLINEKIPLDRIRGAELSSDPESAPALLLAHVRVNLDSGYRLISPKNCEDFISELTSRIQIAEQDA